MGQKRNRRLIPHFSRSRFFAIVGTGRSPLLCGALPPAKRHGSESRYHFCVAHRRARHHLARVPSLTHVGADCADKDHCAPRMSPYGMPPCETHAGGTQCMPLSATSDSERSCRHMREHARYRLMDVRHTRNERRHERQEGRACRALSTRRSSRTSPA